MGALLPTLVLLAASPCFVPSDQTAGWKHVVLPDNAPALAAPEGTDQFRPNEPVRVLESDSRLLVGSYEMDFGRTELHFAIPKGTHHLEVELLEPLRGSKVDALASSWSRTLPLLSERRVAGNTLSFDWEAPDVNEVTVSIHHHFRERPVARRWRILRSAVLAEDASVSAAFKLGRSLYYRQPGDKRIELCDAPGRRLELDFKTLGPGDVPTSVNLVPK